MNIKIFGQLADITGTDLLVLNHLSNSDALEEMLKIKYPALKNAKYKIAVNRNIIQSNTELNNDAEIALLPPYSGG